MIPCREVPSIVDHAGRSIGHHQSTKDDQCQGVAINPPHQVPNGIQQLLKQGKRAELSPCPQAGASGG